jgi:predicted nucleotidyltransferase
MQFIQQLIKNYQPEKVILFGSRATGNFREDSDYDFLIIKETSTRRLNRREEALAGIERNEPTDVLILTPWEVQYLLERDSQFIKEIFETGKVIYERK